MESSEIESFAKDYVKVFAQKQQAAETLRRQYEQEAVRLAQVLRTQFGATRVIIFGSVLDVQKFSPSSDIDLAVDGLPPDNFWQATAFVQSSRSFPVDLIDLASARPSLRQRINESGRVLI